MWPVIERMKCNKCGAPFAIGFFMRWNDNGTLGIRWVSDLPFVVLDTGLYESIFTYIEEILGLSIRHLVFESVRNVCRSVFTEIFDRLPLSDLLGSIALEYKTTVRLLYMMADISGYMRGTMVRHSKGRYSVLVVRNPFQKDILAGVLDGAFEFLDGVPYEGEWRLTGEGEYLVTEIPSEEKPEVSQRLEKEYAKPPEGHHALEVCSRCGVPRIISDRLVWKMSEGRVVNRRTGKRVGFFPPDVLRPTFRELHEELGDEILVAIKDGMRKFTIDNIDSLMSPIGSGDYETVLGNYLDEMPAFGQGYLVSAKIDESKTVIVIGNPFERYLVGGIIQGIYEGCNKKECSYSMQEVEREIYSYVLEY